jgi:YVTN family beta-propeller protein
VARGNFNDVLVINALNYQVVTSIPTGQTARYLAISPDGTTLYVGNAADTTVSVIDTSSNTVTHTIMNVLNPAGLSITPDGGTLYAVNANASTVTLIDTGTNSVVGTIAVGTSPVAFGNFIQPLPKFAGAPGASDCQGVSVSTLATKYGGLNKAAAAFGFAKVQGLQDAIRAFCHRTMS